MCHIIWLTGIFIYCLLQIMFQSPYENKLCSDNSFPDQRSPEKIYAIDDIPPRNRVQFIDDGPSLNIIRSVDVIPSRNEIPFTEALHSQDMTRFMDNVPSRNTVSSKDVLPARVVSGIIQDENHHILPYANLSYVTRENKYVAKTDGYGTYKISVPVETHGTWRIEKDGKVFKDEYTYLFHSYDGFTILNFALHEMPIFGNNS